MDSSSAQVTMSSAASTTSITTTANNDDVDEGGDDIIDHAKRFNDRRLKKAMEEYRKSKTFADQEHKKSLRDQYVQWQLDQKRKKKEDAEKAAKEAEESASKASADNNDFQVVQSSDDDTDSHTSSSRKKRKKSKSKSSTHTKPLSKAQSVLNKRRKQSAAASAVPSSSSTSTHALSKTTTAPPPPPPPPPPTLPPLPPPSSHLPPPAHPHPHPSSSSVISVTDIGPDRLCMDCGKQKMIYACSTCMKGFCPSCWKSSISIHSDHRCLYSFALIRRPCASLNAEENYSKYPFCGNVITITQHDYIQSECRSCQRLFCKTCLSISSAGGGARLCRECTDSLRDDYQAPEYYPRLVDLGISPNSIRRGLALQVPVYRLLNKLRMSSSIAHAYADAHLPWPVQWSVELEKLDGYRQDLNGKVSSRGHQQLYISLEDSVVYVEQLQVKCETHNNKPSSGSIVIPRFWWIDVETLRSTPTTPSKILPWAVPETFTLLQDRKLIPILAWMRHLIDGLCFPESMEQATDVDLYFTNNIACGVIDEVKRYVREFVKTNPNTIASDSNATDSAADGNIVVNKTNPVVCKKCGQTNCTSTIECSMAQQQARIAKRKPTLFTEFRQTISKLNSSIDTDWLRQYTRGQLIDLDVSELDPSTTVSGAPPVIVDTLDTSKESMCPRSLVHDPELASVGIGLRLHALPSGQSDGHISFHIQHVVTWRHVKNPLPQWLCLILEWAWLRAQTEKRICTTTFHLSNEPHEAVIVPACASPSGKDKMGMLKCSVEQRKQIEMSPLVDRDDQARYLGCSSWDAVNLKKMDRASVIERVILEKDVQLNWSGLPFTMPYGPFETDGGLGDSGMTDAGAANTVVIDLKKIIRIPTVVVHDTRLPSHLMTGASSSSASAANMSMYVHKTSTLFIPLSAMTKTAISVRCLLPYPLNNAVNGCFWVWNVERISQYLLSTRSLADRGISPTPMVGFHGTRGTRMLKVSDSIHGGGGFRPEYNQASRNMWGTGTYLGLDPVRCTEYAGGYSVKTLSQLRHYWDTVLEWAKSVDRNQDTSDVGGPTITTDAGIASVTTTATTATTATAADITTTTTVTPSKTTQQSNTTPIHDDTFHEYDSWNVIPTYSSIADRATHHSILRFRQQRCLQSVMKAGHVDENWNHPPPPNSYIHDYFSKNSSLRSYIRPDVKDTGGSAGGGGGGGGNDNGPIYGYGVLAVCDFLMGKAQMGNASKHYTDHFEKRKEAKCTTFVDSLKPDMATLAVIPYQSENHILMTLVLSFDHRV